MSFRDNATRLRLVLAAGGLLAAVLFAPAAARASCGDYVTVVHPSGTMPPAPAPDTERAPAPGGPVYPPAPAPCHGPECSPSAPASQAVIPPPSDRLDQCALLTEALSSSRPGQVGPREAAEAPDLSRHPSPVYHPPRRPA